VSVFIRARVGVRARAGVCVTVRMDVKQCNVYVYACVSVRGGETVRKKENGRPLLWKKRDK